MKYVRLCFVLAIAMFTACQQQSAESTVAPTPQVEVHKRLIQKDKAVVDIEQLMEETESLNTPQHTLLQQLKAIAAGRQGVVDYALTQTNDDNALKVKQQVLNGDAFDEEADALFGWLQEEEVTYAQMLAELDTMLNIVSHCEDHYQQVYVKIDTYCRRQQQLADSLNAETNYHYQYNEDMKGWCPYMSPLHPYWQEMDSLRRHCDDRLDDAGLEITDRVKGTYSALLNMRQPGNNGSMQFEIMEDGM